MLLVRTRVGPSPIHGLGVFAAEPVVAGAPIWRFAPGVDLVLGDDEIAGFPDAFRAHLALYAYRSVDVPDGHVLSCDNARFLNHSDAPNTAVGAFVTHSACDIAAGEEITCDYGAFCVGWTGFGDEASTPAAPT